LSADGHAGDLGAGRFSRIGLPRGIGKAATEAAGRDDDASFTRAASPDAS
jgi:hypothetical protein